MTTVPFGVRRFGMALLLATATGAIAPSVSLSQTLQYPPYGSVRGRAVARDGLFHSQRYHWRNGLTPVGGEVLVHGIDVLGPAAVSFANVAAEALRPGLGRGVADEDNSLRSGTRSVTEFTAPKDYVDAQLAANALLVRTAALIDSSGPTDKQSGPISPQSLIDLLKKAGPNPWTGSATATPSTSNGQSPAEKPALEELLKKFPNNSWKAQ